MALRVAPISARHELATLTKYKRAVEVGTHRGDFAEQLARVRRGLVGEHGFLSCIDPWASFPGYEAQERMLDGGGLNRGLDRSIAERLLRNYIRAGEVELVTGFSPQASELFKDESLDLVYLDGDHSYEAVLADIEAWWPKLRTGGLLAGHDIVCPGEADGGWGQYTQQAVHEFSWLHSLDVWLIVEAEGRPWSFYMEKR